MLAWLQELFIEPVAPRAPVAHGPSPATTFDPEGDIEAVVVGLSGRCGATTVAKGLALVLAGAAGRSANLVSLGTGSDDGASSSLGPLRVWRVPRALTDPTEVAQYGAVVARIAGGRGMGTLPTATVWDIPASEASAGAEAMREVGTVIAVARGDSDPVLSELAVGMLADRHERVLLVGNRVASPDDWAERASVCLPESRLAARLIGRGRFPGSALADPLHRLAVLLEAA